MIVLVWLLCRSLINLYFKVNLIEWKTKKYGTVSIFKDISSVFFLFWLVCWPTFVILILINTLSSLAILVWSNGFVLWPVTRFFNVSNFAMYQKIRSGVKAVSFVLFGVVLRRVDMHWVSVCVVGPLLSTLATVKLEKEGLSYDSRIFVSFGHLPKNDFFILSFDGICCF